MANGGIDSSTATFTITVAPINQAPTLTGAGDQTVLEDAGAQSVQWATGIGPGAPDESSQAVTLSTANDNPSLFSSQPTLGPTGVLTYTPAPDANGSANVTVQAHDDGGTANGGQDTTTRTFAITVKPVNDAPTFTTTGNVSVLENGGPQALAWVTSQSPGPPTRPRSTSPTRPSTTTPLSSPLAPSRASRLTGRSRSHPQPTPRDRPSSPSRRSTTAAPRTAATTRRQRRTRSPSRRSTTRRRSRRAATRPCSRTRAHRAFSGRPRSTRARRTSQSQTVTFTTTNDNNAIFSSQPTISPTGVLAYTPAANANGTTTVTVTAQDNGGTANGGHDSTTATFTITVTPVNDARRSARQRTSRCRRTTACKRSRSPRSARGRPTKRARSSR